MLASDTDQADLEAEVGDSIPDTATTDELARLSLLPSLEYEQQREGAAKELGVRVSALDRLVIAERKTQEQQSETDELADGIEPWEMPVDGNELAESMKKTITRYSILPSGGVVTLTLWAIATYCIDNFRIFPKLLINSPEKRCGKTTTMEVLGALVYRALMASNLSPAVIFRSIDYWHPSLLIDEGDTFLNGNEELRGIINSGHTRSTAFVLRVEGDSSNMVPKRFSTWSPMCIGMIKTPPDTIKDRSVIVTLRRKLPGEQVGRLPLDLNEHCLELRKKAVRWSTDNAEALRKADPQVPTVGNDRAEDNWRPLLAIADLLGGEWPEEARRAMSKLEDVTDTDEGIGPMILSDIRSIFDEKKVSRFHSKDLVDHLIDLDERPWCEWKHGKPITKNSLSRMLKPFGIRSKDVRIGSVKKGYDIADFKDTFSRYLPPPPIQNATTLQPSNHAGSSQIQNATEGAGVAFQNSSQPSNHGGCSVVALQDRGTGEQGEEMEVFKV